MDINAKLAIEITDAGFGYEKGSPVLSGLSLGIHKGEAVGLIGANGAGKSTLLKMLTGLLPHEGSIRINGLEAEDRNLAEIRRHLGFVFQDADSQLFMPRVYDDLAFAPRNYGLSPEDVESRVDEALERLHISYLKYRQNYKMSGGEKRMASIASVLTMEPEILLLDEPSITLDPFNRRSLIGILNEMPETRLIASHDLDMILETCDRVVLLSKGKLRADLPARELLCDRELLAECHLEPPFCLQEPQWH